MKKEMKNSASVFLILIAVMILIKIFDLVFNPNKVFFGRTAVFSWIEILIIFALGILGLFFYNKVGLLKFLNKEIKKKKTILTSIGLGLGFSLVFVIYDLFVKIGNINVGLPTGIFFYIWGAISTETIFRIFAIGIFSWLIGNLILKKKYNKQVYWIIAIILSLVAAFSMTSAFSNPEIPLNPTPNILILVLGALVFASELTAFKLLKKYGFLSPLIFRLSFYSIWHIIWPVIFY